MPLDMLLDIFILEGLLESEIQNDNKDYLRLYSGRKRSAEACLAVQWWYIPWPIE